MRGAVPFLLGAFAAGAAGAACPPRTLATAGRGGLAPEGRREATLTFMVAAPATAWAELRGLRVPPAEDGDADPEAFLDGTYLGTLRAEDGGAWRSPGAVPLAAGVHAFRVRLADVDGAVGAAWAAAAVLADGPCPPPRGPAAPCGSVPRRAWLAPAPRAGIALSAPSGGGAETPVLARLAPGDAWTCRVDVTADPAGRPRALRLGVLPEPGTRLRLVFYADAAEGRVEAVNYRPGAWEPLTLTWCSGMLALRFAAAPAVAIPWERPTAELSLSAEGVDLRVRPAP